MKCSFFFLFTVITKIPFNYVPKVQFVGTGLFCLQLTVLVSVRVSEERLPGVVFQPGETFLTFLFTQKQRISAALVLV